MEMIREANAFQLFWSTNSVRSDFVRQEYQYALALRREDFVRPVFGKHLFLKTPRTVFRLTKNVSISRSWAQSVADLDQSPERDVTNSSGLWATKF